MLKALGKLGFIFYEPIILMISSIFFLSAWSNLIDVALILTFILLFSTKHKYMLLLANNKMIQCSLTSILIPMIFPTFGIIFLMKIMLLKSGFSYIFYGYLVVEVHDSAAMLSGKYLGRRKIWPKLSPQKTWVGTIVGIIIALTTGIAARDFVFFSFDQAVFCSCVLILSAISGDILTSWIKRETNIKDFSHLVPTQGGLLDIYDSLIFASPAYFLILSWFKIN